jgi:hypothetical protein
MTLCEFIEGNRDELILRCRAKVATRSDPPPTDAEIDYGVPLFLDQLMEELRNGESRSQEISKGAIKHGHELFLQGFSISGVVHDYGDVCQSITDLSVELNAPIGAGDFRTLNRCLDDAIAGAVTEYAREQDVPRNGELHHLLNLTNTTITAFEALQKGNVGVGGSTGALVHRNLIATRAALLSRLPAEVAPRVTAGKPGVRRSTPRGR